MPQNVSKTEDNCTQAMKQAAKIALWNNMNLHDAREKTSRSHLSNPEYAIQDAVYHILLKLNLRAIFPSMYFV